MLFLKKGKAMENNFAKSIVPCLDIKDGKVCKGINFEGIREVGNILDLAKKYEEDGADEIVLLDITATTENRKTFLDVLQAVRKEISIPIAIGGGVKTLDDFDRLFGNGATKLSINSAAVKNPSLLEEASKKFGSEKIICAIDAVRCLDGGFRVVINGGKLDSGLELGAWAREIRERGAGEILLTSKSADGSKSGYDLEMTQLVCEESSLSVTASGGCGKLDDFLELFQKTKAQKALAASVFHFNELTVSEVKKYLSENGVRVRL